MPSVKYIADCDVDATMDSALRDVLSACFTKPGDDVFRERRYWHEMPHHRWFIRSPAGEIIAHVAVHEKLVVCDGQEHRIGGVADVCVRPEHRGHGYVKVLLARAHEWLKSRGFVYAVLIGETRVYASSGYGAIQNLFNDQPTRQRVDGAMVAKLGDRDWPVAEVFLPGQVF